MAGPQVAESDELNPFTHYVVWTELKHQSGKTWNIRGFFAADGNAEFSSADSGDKWRTLFTPQSVGKYTYLTRLYQGENAAISE